MPCHSEGAQATKDDRNASKLYMSYPRAKRSTQTPLDDSMDKHTPQTLEALVEQARQGFANRYGRPCRWVVAAPGRVNLIGEHTDYNGGFVLPMAIEGYTVIAADRPAERAGDAAGASGSSTVPRSTSRPPWHSIPLRPPPESNHWSNYVLGVVAGCQAAGMRPGPIDAWIASSVPVGGGLSSSAAIEVATATLVEAITGEDDSTKWSRCGCASGRNTTTPICRAGSWTSSPRSWPSRTI